MPASQTSSQEESETYLQDNGDMEGRITPDVPQPTIPPPGDKVPEWAQIDKVGG